MEPVSRTFTVSADVLRIILNLPFSMYLLHN